MKTIQFQAGRYIIEIDNVTYKCTLAKLEANRLNAILPKLARQYYNMTREDYLPTKPQELCKCGECFDCLSLPF